MLNEAVTEALLVKVNVQGPVPVQAPDHPEKVDPAFGVAVRVTEVPLVNNALHTEPQLMPEGLLVTTPLPLPESATVSAGDGEITTKDAVTEALAVKFTLQVAAPLQAPLQPVKVELAAGVAVRVIEVPGLNAAWQVVPQLMPAGSLVTVPLPVPERLRASTGDVAKVADTVIFDLTVTVHVLEPLQAPPQLTNVDPALGVAVNVTAVPPGKLLLQVLPQLMPLGLLTTAPLPVG